MTGVTESFQLHLTALQLSWEQTLGTYELAGPNHKEAARTMTEAFARKFSYTNGFSPTESHPFSYVTGITQPHSAVGNATKGDLRLLVLGLTPMGARVLAGLSQPHGGFLPLKSHFQYFKLCIFHHGIIERGGNTQEQTKGENYKCCLKRSVSKRPGLSGETTQLLALLDVR